MINTVQARAAIAATAGADMVIDKVQYGVMLDELERGNAARIQLTNVRSIVNAGARRAGLDS